MILKIGYDLTELWPRGITFCGPPCTYGDFSSQLGNFGAVFQSRDFDIKNAAGIAGSKHCNPKRSAAQITFRNLDSSIKAVVLLVYCYKNADELTKSTVPVLRHFTETVANERMTRDIEQLD